MDARSPAAGEERASPRTWMAVLGCMLGALMSALDIQVTNSSLPQIEGGISTGEANGTWISTAYLIGEIIMIPMANYLSQVLSFRRFMIGCTILFLGLSMGCAFAPNLDTMIVLRGLQGFSAGGMIPMAMSFALANLPRAQQPVGIAVFAMTTTFGPAIGPTLGGYLTTNFDWQYVFFINLVPGALMLALLFPTLDREKMRLDLLKEGDWWGIAFMTVGLACLQTMLDEGNRNNWFGSPFIVKLAIVSAVSLTVFIIIELIVAKPVVELRLFAYRNFSFGTLANVVVGWAIFGSIYVLPTYLDEVQNYDAEQVGMVMAWAGIPQLFLIPFVPLLVKHVNIRLLISTGLLIFAASCFMDSRLSADFAGDQFVSSNIVRAVGQAITMTPLTLIALSGLPKDLSGPASGLFNMLRSLGGAVGTAALATIVSKREQYHAVMMGNSNPSTNPTAIEFLDQMQSYFLAQGMTDPDAAHHAARILLADLGQEQALIMGYADSFYIMGVMLAAAIAAVLLTRTPR